MRIILVGEKLRIITPALQHKQDLNDVIRNPIEDEVVAIDLPADAVAAAMFNELIGRRSRTNFETGATQFPHETGGPWWIVFCDPVANRREIVFSGLGNDNFHAL